MTTVIVPVFWDREVASRGGNVARLNCVVWDANTVVVNAPYSGVMLSVGRNINELVLNKVFVNVGSTYNDENKSEGEETGPHGSIIIMRQFFT